jgi:hypothetical protein
MAETGRLAAWVRRAKGFDIREYPVPDPAAGAAPVEVALSTRGASAPSGAIAPN